MKKGEKRDGKNVIMTPTVNYGREINILTKTYIDSNPIL